MIFSALSRHLTVSILAVTATFAFASTAMAQGVLPEGAKWEKISSAGKAFGEGVVAARDGTLYLVDLAPPGTLFRYDPKSGETTKVMEPSGMANGLHIDKNGDLLMAQGQPGAVKIAKRNLTTGEVTTVVDSIEGKHLIAPNDITTDA
ncbi:MAG: SMP-30/gluconolactonase/LRE family protein [Xanthobacteraceae bacterium]